MASGLVHFHEFLSLFPSRVPKYTVCEVNGRLYTLLITPREVKSKSDRRLFLKRTSTPGGRVIRLSNMSSAGVMWKYRERRVPAQMSSSVLTVVKITLSAPKIASVFQPLT
ncbi:hypothetical protein AVEN_36967-1 [Araneus ventricosus]|uniref:Uncharacterized protein n=1 Tax=Araneus ventricosus TaxID=182803 RepID=A0A4Y2M205_ARAVE|nr:hypothetical protein AVEN_36967-1 [Araneus ventricosus]